MEFHASNSTELFVERRWDGGRREGGQRRKMLVSSKPTISSFNIHPISTFPNLISSQMALGLMVGAAAFFAVGFLAAGTGKDLKDGPPAEQKMKDGPPAQQKMKDGSPAQQKMEENAKQDEEYDYSWAMQGVNRSRIR